MDIPNFPNFREIRLEDKPVFDKLLKSNPPELSTYTFTNLFAWREPYNTSVSTLNGSLVIRHEQDNRLTYIEPIGSHDKKEIIKTIFEHHKYDSIEFQRICSETAELFFGGPEFIVEPNRNDFDYLYLSDDLIHLKGRKYDAKRQFIKRFEQNYNFEYLRMNQEIAGHCRDFQDYWCEDRKCREFDGMAKEHEAVHAMLENFDALGIIGGAILVDGRIVAFSLGEPLNPETLVIHVEKGDLRFDGSYQMINHQFASREAINYKYINREQDLGIPGLRKAKESYHPVKLIESYSIKLA